MLQDRRGRSCCDSDRLKQRVLSCKQLYAASAARRVGGIENRAFDKLGNAKPETLRYRNAHNPRTRTNCPRHARPRFRQLVRRLLGDALARALVRPIPRVRSRRSVLPRRQKLNVLGRRGPPTPATLA